MASAGRLTWPHSFRSHHREDDFQANFNQLALLFTGQVNIVLSLHKGQFNELTKKGNETNSAKPPYSLFYNEISSEVHAF